ncbi:MAG: hypothetical protein HUJ98_14625 [Bacteroidaceae bacterium]|nr:hypothetical protein [Bacteroidaceae bacterium]
MAFNVTALNEYIEEQRGNLLSAIVLAPRSIEMFSHEAGIKGKTALNIMDNTISIQQGGCSFSPNGTTTFTQRFIDPMLLKINEEWCDLDLLRKWTEYEVAVGAGKERLPFEQEITSDIVAKVALEMEKLIWNGGTIGASSYTGIENILSTESTVVQVTEGADIIETVNKVVMAIPEEVVDRASIFMSPATFRKYVLALGAKNLYHYDPNISTDVFVPNTDIKIEKIVGIANNRIYALDATNVHYGYDATSDMADFDLWYSKDAQQWRLKIQWLSGLQIAFPQYCVRCAMA